MVGYMKLNIYIALFCRFLGDYVLGNTRVGEYWMGGTGGGNRKRQGVQNYLISKHMVLVCRCAA